MAKTLTFFAALLSSVPAIAQWNPPLATFAPVVQQLDSLAKPLVYEFFDPKKFEQDELGSELAVFQSKIQSASDCESCESEKKQEKKNWIATFNVSGSLAPPRFLQQSFETRQFQYWNPYWLKVHQEAYPQKNTDALSSREIARDLVAHYNGLAIPSFGSPGTIDFSQYEEEYFNGITLGRVINAKTDQEWKNALKEASQTWSTKRKLDFISHMGSWNSANYDFERANGGPRSKGVVNVLELARGLREFTPAGVCRDIASAQGEMLQALGFTNVYVFGYTGPSPHATVIATDPSNPRELLKFNYSNLTRSSDHLEINSLHQWGDKGQDYEVFKPGGQMVAQGATELGNFLQQQSGMDIRQIDVFNRMNAPYVGSLRVARGNMMANVFTGRLTNGSTIVGAAAQKSWGDPKEEKVATELAGAYAKQIGGVEDLDANHLMMRFTQHLNSPWVKFNESVRARFETSGQYMRDTVPSGWLHGNAGIRLERRTDQSEVGVRASTQFAEGAKDIRESGNFGIFHNLTYVSVDGEKKLNPEWSGIFDAAVGFRHFGPQIMVSAGARNPATDTTVRAGYEGALRTDVPAIMPGMSKKIFAEANTDVKGWTLSAIYLQPLSREGRGSPTIRGSATKVFKKK